MPAFKRGFSPFRYHPGIQRSLTALEKDLVGTSCLHCGKAMIRDETSYSVYVRCPERKSLFIDPFHEDPYHKFKSYVEKTSKKVSKVIRAHREKEAAKVEPTPGEMPGLMREKLEAVASPEEVEILEKAGLVKESKKAYQIYGDFPMDWCLKLAKSISDAARTGKVAAAFSLRREVMLARLFKAFYPVLGGGDAFRVAFALTASERATDEEMPFYVELWRSLVGTNLYPLPEIRLAGAALMHPMAGIAEIVLNAGVPLWLAGEAGAGKTHLTRELASRRSQRYVRLQGSRDRTIDEVIGAWGYDPAKGSTFRYGVIAEAARDGALLHIDEVSAMPHEVTFELHAMLEGEQITISKNSGESIPLNPKFVVVANDNTVGDGESPQYVGTTSTNLAFRDRWAFLKMPAMSTALRKQIIAAEL